MEIDTSWSYTQEAFACACVDITLVDTGVTNPERHRLKRTVEDVCPACEIPFTKVSEHDYTKIVVTISK